MNKFSIFHNGLSKKLDYRKSRIVATNNILKVFISLYKKIKDPYKYSHDFIGTYYLNTSFFVKLLYSKIFNLKSIEFKLDKDDITNFSNCKDFDIAALLSYRLERNFISYFVKNSYFYVRKITMNDRIFWSIELYYIKDYISEMWHQESEEYIKLMNDLNTDYMFSSASYYKSYQKYNKKISKLPKKRLKYKLKILKKKINPDNVTFINKYSNIDKDFNSIYSMYDYINKNHRRNFLLKSKKLHKKTLKSKLNILNRYINPDLSKKIKEYYWISANNYIQKKYINNDYIQIKTYDENMIADLDCSELEWDNPTSPYWPMSETCPNY